MKTLQALTIALLCVALFAYKAQAEVPNPGFKSLFIGHSFFSPVARGMPDLVAGAGIAGHSQLVVFSGGNTGSPLALWNDPTKSAEIKAYLDGGDVELFGMTYASSETGEGYENWINYALEKNPTTRFFIGIPWFTFPSLTADSAIYLNNYKTTYTTTWRDYMDDLRALDPGVDIFSIPYGQAAGELRVLFDAGNLPNSPGSVVNLTGPAESSIFIDALGHGGSITLALSRLVWLNAIYDVDLLTTTIGTYSNDFKAIAQTVIMDAHDPAYDAAYHVDADGDRIGDSIDNCPNVANPDQADSNDNGIGDLCEIPGC